MPFLLMVFLSFACMPELKDWPPALWGESPAWGGGLAAWLGVLLVVAYAWRLSRGVSRPLEEDPSARQTVLQRYERGRFVHQVLLLSVFTLALCLGGWGYCVEAFWKWGSQDRLLPGAEVILLSPFLAALAGSWACFYDADRAAHRAAHRLPDLDSLTQAFSEPQTAAALPLRPGAVPVWDSRAAYVLFQARQKLALVLIPILLLLIQKEFQRNVGYLLAEWEGQVTATIFLSLTVVLVLMPWILRLALGLRPLPPGPLRDRLLASARRLNFRCSDVLLWDTRQGMANAMVVGVLPWLRYVVFTDRLLAEFSEEEVEAVFGHEVGHVRHHHMLYYLAFLTASLLVIGLASGLYLRPWLAQSGLVEWASGHLPEFYRPYLNDLLADSGTQYLEAVPLGLAYVFVVFGFLSRRCERQADVCGCRAVSCDRPDCTDHEPGSALAAGGRSLCPVGTRVFIRALEKVAVINGISRDRPGLLQSWQHSTIGRRVAFLQQTLLDPDAEPRFQRRLALVKWALALVLGSALVWLVSVNGWRI